MAKKEKEVSFVTLSHVERDLEKMTYRTLKKEVILRGMPFEEVINGDYGKLSSFFQKNYHTPQDPGLVVLFDNWLEKNLKERNVDKTFLDPSLRLSYVEQREDDPSRSIVRNKKTNIPKPESAPKVLRERTEDGIFKGTKKALTHELCKKGLSKDVVIKKVMEKYPDASIKSIGIWYNKAKKNATQA